jgi:hypothetical protein
MDITDAVLLQIVQGDGDTPETPVLFAPCHIRVRVLAERLFIEERYGGMDSDWSEELHYTSPARQSVWNIRLKAGTLRSVYFDTSNTTYDK